MNVSSFDLKQVSGLRTKANLKGKGFKTKSSRRRHRAHYNHSNQLKSTWIGLGP